MYENQSKMTVLMNEKVAFQEGTTKIGSQIERDFINKYTIL